eukprot:scaffold44128_cov75-Cyclotella_meneghiniana.AAC.2
MLPMNGYQARHDMEKKRDQTIKFSTCSLLNHDEDTTKVTQHGRSAVIKTAASPKITSTNAIRSEQHITRQNWNQEMPR